MAPERTYRIRVAARLSGLSEEVIRAWERRYGVPRPRRTPNGYRVYTESDIALLRRLRLLTVEGMAIGDAARFVAASPEEVPRRGAALDGDHSTVARWHRQILTAAEQLDQRAVQMVLDDAFATLPALRVYERLLAPALREVGDRWCAGSLGVPQEHLVSQAIRARLAALLVGAGRGGGRRALCACFPDEQHDIGLLGAALRLRSAGFRLTYLGACTPVEELVRAARRLTPEVVALGCVNDVGAKQFLAVLDAVLRRLPRESRLLLGGAGTKPHARLLARRRVIFGEDERGWEAVGA